MSRAKLWKTKIPKMTKFLLIFVLAISWIFSDFPRIFNFPPEIPIEVFAEEIATTSIITETATTTSETASTTAEEIPLPEEPIKKQSLLLNLFGAVFDLLFGENDLTETAETENGGDKILKEKIYGDVRVAAISRNSKAELWIGDLAKENWQKIANEETISENSPIGFQDNVIFWLSPDERAVVWLNTLSQENYSQSIEPTGDTVIEFNSQKYILAIQNDNITIIPQINEISF